MRTLVGLSMHGYLDHHEDQVDSGLMLYPKQKSRCSMNVLEVELTEEGKEVGIGNAQLVSQSLSENC
jgi:hypothetical protein